MKTEEANIANLRNMLKENRTIEDEVFLLAYAIKDIVSSGEMSELGKQNIIHSMNQIMERMIND